MAWCDETNKMFGTPQDTYFGAITSGLQSLGRLARGPDSVRRASNLGLCTSLGRSAPLPHPSYQD